MIKKTIVVMSILLMSITIFAQKSYKNPAAAYCKFMGYNYSLQSDKQGNEIGVCTLPSGERVNAWDFYKGKVGKEYSYAAKKGYTIECVKENLDGYTVERAICTKNVKGAREKLTLEELMAKNGDVLQLDIKGSQKDIYETATENPNFTYAKSTPTSFDWRSYNSHSYIGSVRDQGDCGSCYAFGASACAEGTYNYAMGLYDGNTSDFSEAYIAWCLGAMSQYSGNFSGCNGADYTYSELQALCDIGTIPESYFPYSDADNQSCPSSTSSAPKTKFSAWYRVACSDIEAIKTAIMTYGVVDAAVYVTTSFQNYSGGIYSDSYTACSSSPCYNTPTNHAIALVGWGTDATTGDYWILRNSWGSSWGEDGYMRIDATSARVACEVCYMVYQVSNPTAPTATTGAASGISTTTATLNATVNANNATTTVTFEYGLTTSYGSTINGTPNSISGATATSITAALTGLTANTTYNYRVKAVNSVGTTYGSNMTFTTSDVPTSLPLPVTENFGSSTLPANWTTQNTGTSITERWSMSNTANAGGAAYELKCSYQNVNPGTTRVITPAVNTVGVSQVTFSFRHMLDAYGTGATLRVQTSNDKSTWTNTTWSVATGSTNIAAATVNVTITSNLNSETTYFAFVLDGNLYQIDYWYIDNVSITGSSSVVVPTVTTTAASSITASSATSGGNVTADGGATVTERGICYSTAQNPTTTNSKVTSGSGTGTFTANMTGLTANTTYYVRAYAINSAGTAYGSQVSFTTLDVPTSLPLPVTENFGSSTLPTNWTTQNTGTGITERWSMSNTANAGGAAYELKCSYQQVNPGTTRVVTPAVNTVGVSQITFSFKHMLDAYAAGVTLRVQTSNDKTTWTNTGWSVATSATNIAAATVNVTVTTNLNSETTYFALVADGDLYQIDYWYIDNISITSGSTTIPTVTTTAASSITESSATSGGNVTADGGATVTERGICYATTANPTTANSKVVSGSGTGTFTANMTGLAASTTYYVRAYAINSVGTAYGSQVSFTTLPSGETVVTVGTGTSTQGYPINCYYGYERSASIYTAAEVGVTGSVTKVGWYPTLTTSYNVPVKIYIKHTTSSTLTASTWATLTTGATLVYSGTMAGTTANTWREFALTTLFNFTGGTNNLMVLVETNYGGTGAGTSTGARVRYSTATSKHLYIRADNSAPTGNGTVTSYRPNIRLTISGGLTTPRTNEDFDQNTDIISTISAYPNPTTGIISVKSEGSIKSIDVYSVTGAKILSFLNVSVQTSKEIDLSKFNNGTYIIVVNDGIKEHTLKVIKR